MISTHWGNKKQNFNLNLLPQLPIQWLLNSFGWNELGSSEYNDTTIVMKILKRERYLFFFLSERKVSGDSRTQFSFHSHFWLPLWFGESHPQLPRSRPSGNTASGNALTPPSYLCDPAAAIPSPPETSLNSACRVCLCQMTSASFDGDGFCHPVRKNPGSPSLPKGYCRGRRHSCGLEPACRAGKRTCKDWACVGFSPGDFGRLLQGQPQGSPSSRPCNR